MNRAMAIVTFASLLIAGMAQADIRCAVPMTKWQPREAVMQLAQEKGWTVRRIKIDDGCYEIVGTDATGAKLKVKVHPGTLAILPDKPDHENDSGNGNSAAAKPAGDDHGGDDHNDDKGGDDHKGGGDKGGGDHKGSDG